jgi:hypothetical protein
MNTGNRQRSLQDLPLGDMKEDEYQGNRLDGED